jgi:DNA-binding MarR family transcriptional regulator
MANAATDTPTRAATGAAPTGSADSTAAPPELLQAAGELRVAVGRIVRRLRRPNGAAELTPSELSVLARLDEHGPCGPAALAEIEQVSPPVVCASLAGLQRFGMVDRAPDPHDGRRVVISLTAAGRSALTARRSALAHQVAGALTTRFNPAERQQLLDAVPLLQRLAADL